MKTGRFTLGFAYLRLSNEEAQGGEASSITNQRMIMQNYCKQNSPMVTICYSITPPPELVCTGTGRFIPPFTTSP